MGLFSNPEVVVIKEGNSARRQLAALEALRGTLPPLTERQLESDIRVLKAGIVGEDRIMFELQNSHIDMFVLHDLCLEHEGLSAQIDFLVLTLQRIFVIECKNLHGNIEVNEKGDFARSFDGRRKEGIYSPIAQNQRHLELIRAMKRDSRGLVLNLLFDRDFDDVYRNLVVFANPKSVLDDRRARPEVKEKLVRVDRLVDTIKAVNKEKGPGREKAFRSGAREGAEWFLAQHKDREIDYARKYRAMAEEEQRKAAQTAEGGAGPSSVRCPKCGSPMVLRMAKRGSRAGKKLYGCSNYPACHGIVNVE